MSQPKSDVSAETSKFNTTANTVRVDAVRIGFSADQLAAAATDAWTRRIASCVAEIDRLRAANHGWFPLEGGGLYFDRINAVLPDPDKVQYDRIGSCPGYHDGQTFKVAPRDLEGVLPTREEMSRILCDAHNPYLVSANNSPLYYWVFRSDSGSCYSVPCKRTNDLPPRDFGLADRVLKPFPKHAPYILQQRGIYQIRKKDNSSTIYDNGSGDSNNCYIYGYISAANFPLFRLSSGWHDFGKDGTIPSAGLLVLWGLFDLVPQGLGRNADFRAIAAELKAHPGRFRYHPPSDGQDAVPLSWVAPSGKGGGAPLTLAEVPQDDLLRDCRERLLSCDVERTDIRPAYDEKQLTSPDVNCGHWDLWKENAAVWAQGAATVALSGTMYARNPRCDVRAEGVIGIDFGTKNTTVVRFIDRERPKPMRIGHVNFDVLPTDVSDYENPTVMQFIDMASFLDAYRRSAGRPTTKWRDLTISHTAADKLRDAVAGASDEFTSFLSELKQWVGGSGTLRIQDRKGHETILPAYGRLAQGDPDPIEIYAYYLGANINHMRNGIYLRYELSYPVTYDKDVLDRLRGSFERGIRKSLPASVLNDAELMKRFYVRFGASEPAAYSLCALTEYGFRPKGKERVFYGVFDFGGGTTDFDYGIFRDVDDDEGDQGYDYVLEHFRPSGDKYLGGENLLQLMAYHVFKANRETLLRENITFTRPIERENSSFEGEEGLVSDSPEAKINMRQVMEKLRPLWEVRGPAEAGASADAGGPRSVAAEGTGSDELDREELSMTLFDRKGTQKSGIKLKFEREALEKLLRDRIQRGVTNFFLRLQETFRMPQMPADLDAIQIFLAGNSCKSRIVGELFAEGIANFEKVNEAGRKGKFKVFPPLGTAAARKKMEERKQAIRAGVEQPTGKTGVAFGLVWGRDGGTIKVIDRNQDATGHIAFRFYVGVKRKGIFVPKLTMETPVGKWIKALSVGERCTVELNYSNLAEAGTGELPIDRTSTVNCTLSQPADRDKVLWIRVRSANAFEWAVAVSEKKIDESSVCRVDLD